MMHGRLALYFATNKRKINTKGGIYSVMLTRKNHESGRKEMKGPIGKSKPEKPWGCGHKHRVL